MGLRNVFWLRTPMQETKCGWQGMSIFIKGSRNQRLVILLLKGIYMKLTTGLLHETALFIKEFYDAEFSGDFTFHNYNRAVTIVRNCDALGIQMNLDKEDVRILHIAAWFLETGYCKDYNNYQIASVALANNYLKEKLVDDEIIRAIEDIILSTRIPQQPVTLMAQVLCDASMYHLAEKKFLSSIENLRIEYRGVCKKEYTDKDWLAENINTINHHFYFTSAAKEMFEKKKQKQKASMQKQPDETQNDSEENGEQTLPSVKNEKSIIPLPEDIKTERGVETFFRITERRHIELAAKAHDKASLLISVNSIVISIVLSVLFTKLEENKFLLLPTLLLVLTCGTTIILAIISTKPRFLRKADKNNQATDHEFNILFFGDFSNLSLSDYKKAMKETYKNKNDLYDSLSRDIYYQGIVLAWKYKYINIAYNVFMYGFIITILSFIIAFMIKTM
jgi:predicted metal-dependent HD superfamily phosphohydrolase